MSPSIPTRCSICGAWIPVRVAHELCPACLMDTALRPLEDEELPEAVHDHRDFGGYRLVGSLGSGGMGTVYEAEQIATGRFVALKVLKHSLDSRAARDRFLREGQLAASISHPNSLYVFGSEEIEGRSVITMEIAAGGTLSDQLQQSGPFLVEDAIDAILDVIAGLEAALAKGVLHRDIKPSNCFVGADRSTKIGDFGLSVSTRAQDDAGLTEPLAIMGTPAFASPEQLRGDALDVRSEIYSVGATVFTLLVGKPPFQGKNAKDLVAASIETVPPSVRDYRSDVPDGLAQVVARCLAKRPKRRFANYQALRRSLLAYSSTGQASAPLARRAFAGVLDAAVFVVLPAIALHAFFGFKLDDHLLFTQRTPDLVLAWSGLAAFFVLYSTIVEGLFGAGIGKGLMGLRVVGANGHALGVGRAFGRSSMLALTGNLTKLLCFVVMSAEQYRSGGWLLVGLGNLVFFATFLTMRRRNGWATLWDLATRSRVVVRHNSSRRPLLALQELFAERPEAAIAEAALQIGPYTITGDIIPEQWITAHDPVLRRPVWLRKRSTELTAARRDVARPNRTRWLQSIRTPTATWDVIEAPSPGMPLNRLLFDRELRSRDGAHWELMGPWLHDLAFELASAAEDGTLPSELGLAHVWITTSGRAVLLDESWPASERPGSSESVADLKGQQRFLSSIAAHVDPVTVPLHARQSLTDLASASFETPSLLVGSFRSLVSKPVRVSRSQRAASLLAIPILLITFTTLFVVSERTTTGPMTALHEGLPEISRLVILIHYVIGACLAVPQLVSALALRVTPGQFLFGFAVVDASGAPAGRWRLCVRWLIAWALPATVLGSCHWKGPIGFDAIDHFASVMLVPWWLALAAAVHSPERGLHDRWSGCWLVPR